MTPVEWKVNNCISVRLEQRDGGSFEIRVMQGSGQNSIDSDWVILSDHAASEGLVQALIEAMNAAGMEGPDLSLCGYHFGAEGGEG